MKTMDMEMNFESFLKIIADVKMKRQLVKIKILNFSLLATCYVLSKMKYCCDEIFVLFEVCAFIEKRFFNLNLVRTLLSISL